MRPKLSLSHPQGRPFTRPRSYPCALAILAALAIWRIGPASPPALAQEASPTRPAASDTKCELISEAQVLRLSAGANLIDILRSRFPGLQASPSDWRSRSASSFGLRGNNSLVGPSEPLVFVDGLRLPQPGGVGYLEYIEPLDVERIEMLPGPAATTYFGTGASNGVILIYTKLGVKASRSDDARANCPR